MAKLALTSETMIQVSFLVMNLEHLRTRVGSFVLLACWPSCRDAWKGLLLTRWLKRATNFSGRSGDGLEVRGAWWLQFIAGW